MYDPNDLFDITSSDTTYLEIGSGSDKRSFRATIYRPNIKSKERAFPAFIDVHGGAWQGGSRSDGEYIDRSLAASGMVVAAVDFRVAPQDPYPRQVQDVNYAVRWWKTECFNYAGDPSIFGGMGISSGGHTLMLNSLKPHDPAYTKHTSEKLSGTDSTLNYVIGVSAVLDSYERYIYAKGAAIENLIRGTETYFITEENMQLANPQTVLDSKSHQHLPSCLLIHGTVDGNVPNEIPNRFSKTYADLGGDIDLRLFENMPHSFVRTPQPESHAAIHMMKEFIATQVNFR